MGIETIAAQYHRQQAALAKRIALEVDRRWRALNTANLSASWSAVAGEVYALVAGGQLLAASQSDPYVAAALDAQGTTVDPAGNVDPRAFAGVASDGRPLATLLAEPIITVKSLLGGGSTLARAMVGGGIQLDMMVRTQIADAGRTASGVAVASRERVSYVRMVSAGACSRCVVLAGKRYAWNNRFLRHPRCHCTCIPVAEDIPGDILTSPKAYFGQLGTAEQNRVFTKAGAQAIRDGADIGQVVNARRGMYAAGDRTFTREGTTTRGLYGGYIRNPDGTLTRRSDSQLAKSKGDRYRRATSARLTPEQIYAEANGNRDEAIRLLRKFGYLR